METSQTSRIIWGLIIGVIISVVAVGVLYARLRYNVASELESGKWAAGFPLQKVNVPATKCILMRAGFDDSYSAAAYFDGPRSRIDSVVLNERVKEIYHTVTDGLTAYIWKEGELYSTVVSVSELGTSLKGVIFQDIQCEPMWFPDDSIFKAPSVAS